MVRHQQVSVCEQLNGPSLIWALGAAIHSCIVVGCTVESFKQNLFSNIAIGLLRTRNPSWSNESRFRLYWGEWTCTGTLNYEVENIYWWQEAPKTKVTNRMFCNGLNGAECNYSKPKAKPKLTVATKKPYFVWTKNTGAGLLFAEVKWYLAMKQKF